MRILDENDFELAQDDVNYELGHLVLEKLFIAHHEEVPNVEKVSHYEVKTFYFTDGTQLNVETQEDPHIVVIDNKEGDFEYTNLPGENKVLLGTDLYEVIEVEPQEGRKAWDEEEYIQRYVPFTEKELVARKDMQEKTMARLKFLATGPGRLDVTETNVDGLTTSVDDLTLMMAEMVAM